MSNRPLTSDDLEKLTEAARRSDPLFGSVVRDFQPTIQQAIQMVSLNGEPYDPPNGRQRVTFSLRPDLVTEVQGMAAEHDMATSSMVDLLLRVALGEWHEWWNHHGGDRGPTVTGEEVD